MSQGEQGERGLAGPPGEKGRRGRRGVMGIRGHKGDEADRLKLPRRVFLAFVFLAVANAAAIGITASTAADVDKTQEEVVETQAVVVTNQCEVLNRLAETKVFIRGFLEEAKPDSAHEARMFLHADRHLTEGIRSLLEDVERLGRIDWGSGRSSGCKVFRELVNVRRTFR